MPAAVTTLPPDINPKLEVSVLGPVITKVLKSSRIYDENFEKHNVCLMNEQ
jgi:hypothetical protein